MAATSNFDAWQFGQALSGMVLCHQLGRVLLIEGYSLRDAINISQRLEVKLFQIPLDP